MRLRTLALILLLAVPSVTAALPLVAGTEAHAQTPPAATATATTTAEPAPAGDEGLGIGLFAWAFEDGGFSENYLRGLVLYVLGTIGALIAVYSTLGDFLPSMGRGAYDLQKAEADEHRRTRDALLEARRAYVERREDPPSDLAALSDDFVALVTREDQALARQRSRLIAMAVPLYVLLGGFVAAAIASSLTLALAVGFGWTAVLDRIGLGRELAKTAPERVQAVEQLQRETQTARADATALTAANQRLADQHAQMSARYNELVESYRQAQAALSALAGASGGPAPRTGGGGTGSTE
ncbi:MAG: hypothetical protein AB7L91_14255 [Dehalococcoidia bacterium]